MREITLLDGALGTSLWTIAEKNGVAKDPVWKYNIEHPEFVSYIAKQYYDAGSQIIQSNTFGANSPAVKRSSDYDVTKVCYEGVRIVKDALKDTDAKIVMSAGPLTQLLEPYGDLEEDECYQIYDTMFKAGLEAGTDIILLETFMDLEMMKVAAKAALKYDVPVWCSMTFEKVGKTMFGNSVQDVINVLEPMGISAIGMNCSLGPADAVTIIKEYSEHTKLPLLFKPNAGKPILNDDGTTASSFDPYEFAEDIKPALDYVSYLGGCCGTDPEYIKVIREKYF